EAGKSILIKGADGDRVTVSKFAVGQPDQKRVVTTKVDEIIRAVVELGGTYPDVVQALQQAKTSRALMGRFEVDALPDGGREYQPKDEPATAGAGVADEARAAADPLPEKYSAKQRKAAR